MMKSNLTFGGQLTFIVLDGFVAAPFNKRGNTVHEVLLIGVVQSRVS